MKQNLFFLLKRSFFKATFSLIAFFTLEKLNAQIVYTDITDCSTVITTNSSQMNLCSIDFDANGTSEYSFRWDNFGGDWFMHLVPQNFNDNKIALKGTATNIFGGRFVKAFSSNENIGSAETWGTSMPEPFIGESTTDSNFLDLGDKYVGVQFKKNGAVHYGWILVNFSLTGTTRQLTVKSFAYNSVPNQQIGAGQTTNLNVNENSLSETFKIYPNPVREFFKFKYNKSMRSISYEILNTLGQIIKEGTINSNEEEINVSELNQGVYYIRLLKNKNDIVEQQKFIKS